MHLWNTFMKPHFTYIASLLGEENSTERKIVVTMWKGSLKNFLSFPVNFPDHILHNLIMENPYRTIDRMHKNLQDKKLYIRYQDPKNLHADIPPVKP